MKTVVLGVLVLGTAVSAGGGGAQFVEPPDGEQLLVTCREFVDLVDRRLVDKDTPGALCVGLIRGVIDTAKSLSNMVCVPDNLDFDQLVRVIVKYLEDNPDTRGDRDTLLILKGLVAAFPCR